MHTNNVVLTKCSAFLRKETLTEIRYNTYCTPAIKYCNWHPALLNDHSLLRHFTEVQLNFNRRVREILTSSVLMLFFFFIFFKVPTLLKQEHHLFQSFSLQQVVSLSYLFLLHARQVQFFSVFLENCEQLSLLQLSGVLLCV